MDNFWRKLLNNEEENKVPVAARHSKRPLLQRAVTTQTLSPIHQNSRIGLRFDVLPVIFAQREWAGVCRFEISRAPVTFNRW